MLVIFVHGWSVTNTNTYGELPQALAKEAKANGIKDLQIRDIFLSRYVSFDDEVTMNDLVRGFDHALHDAIGSNGKLPVFSCVTHSTGGPVVRHWVNTYHFNKETKSVKSPLRNLVMLAPANHGSALAQLGKTKLSRVKSWFHGVEPGEKILNSLELGSHENWNINEDFLGYDLSKGNFFPSVLIGQSREKKMYDHLNSYTGERGGDGVIRVAGASLKYRFAYLKQSKEMHETTSAQRRPVPKLELVDGSLKSPISSVPLAIVPEAAHGGNNYGIQKSVTTKNCKDKVQVSYILEALKVKTFKQYQALDAAFDELTAKTQEEAQEDRRINTESTKYSMLVFDVRDDAGNPIKDYDMLILAGDKYDPDKLPSGFFVDRQTNSQQSNRLCYFVNHDKMIDPEKGAIKVGFEINPRPAEGIVHFDRCQFRSLDFPLEELLLPNQTLYVDVELTRNVSSSVFEFEKAKRKKSKTRFAGQRKGSW